MSDISKAIKDIPVNEVDVEGGVDSSKGGFIKGSFEREIKKDTEVGVEGEISQKSGWSVFGFFRKKFK